MNSNSQPDENALIEAINSICEGQTFSAHNKLSSNLNTAFQSLTEYIQEIRNKAQEEAMALAQANINAAEMMEELENTKEEFMSIYNILDLAYDSIFIFSADELKFIYANKGAALQVGYSIEELIKLTPLAILSKFTEQEFNTLLNKLLSGKEQKLEFTTVYKHKAGFEIPVDVLLQFIKKENKFVAIIRDAKKRISIESELIRTKEEAESAKKVTDHFLANMSHEIRTPMNGVLGFTDLLLNTNLTVEQKECMEMIASSSESLLVIINDILDYSKLESGMVKLEEIPFDLCVISREVVDLIQQVPQVNLKNLEIVSYGTDESKIVIGDPHRLKQILINLLNNSVKFTEKGYVNLKVFTEPVNDSFYNIEIKIEDSGVGIQKDKIKTIFEKFSQSDISDTRKFGGSGLGLSISRALVEMMNGSIKVESEVGSGSVFIINLKLRRGNDKLIMPKSESIKIDKFHGRILVAEDNLVNQKLISKTLKQLGLTYKIVENGDLAVKECRCSTYNLILMDLQMPVMNGIEATIKIREFNKNTPIVSLTANVIGDIAKDCLQAGMNDFLSKPLKRKFLNAVLNKYLR